MVCQAQTAGTKQTGQLDALHQLMWQMDRVTFQSAYASQCQQPVITYSTVCWVRYRGKFFSRKQSTSSYAFEPPDSSGHLLERGWYILEVKARFSLQEAARWAVYSKPIKQRSK